MTAHKFPLVAVIGWPIQHSLSPQVHGYWLDRYNLNGHYVALPVQPDALTQVLKALPHYGFVGANVTIPHKEAAFAVADQLSPTAQALKAANTLFFQDNQIIADNTDGFGFAENINAAITNTNTNHDWTRPALVLGAGGASRAIVYALLERNAGMVYLTNRTRARADAVCADLGNPERLRVIDWDDRESVACDVGLIVNTTSLGMKGVNPLHFDFANAPKDCVVTDIVYTPLQTTFLQDAKQASLKTVDGLGMLLHQARPGFKRWFGDNQIDPTVDEALRNIVLGQTS